MILELDPIPQKFIVVLPDQQPRHYVSKISHVEIELPDDPMRYTSMPSVDSSKESGLQLELTALEYR